MQHRLIRSAFLLVRNRKEQLVRPHLLAVAALLALLVRAAPAPAQIGWRSDGSGRYPGVNPPTEWAEDKNLLWKTRLPGPSQGSPILVGDRLFVVADPAELICVNAADGKILWRCSNGLEELYGAAKAKEITAEYARLQYGKNRGLKLSPDLQELMKRFAPPPAPAHGLTTNSAATPVSDGRHVYALFGNGVACAYTVAGERRWVKYIQAHTDDKYKYGHGSSPALADGKLIVPLDDLFALRGDTGEISWRLTLEDKHASPIITRVGRTRVVIDPAGAIVRLADGKVLLKNGLLKAGACTPVLHDDVLYYGTYYEGPARAVRLVSAGEDAVKLEKLWERGLAAGGGFIASPVLHQGLLYSASTQGFLDVLDASTGAAVYRERLNIGSVWASVTAAGDYVYISGTSGTTLVLAPGRTYREVARNQLETRGDLGSSPVFTGRRLFLRTWEHLYCIGR